MTLVYRTSGAWGSGKGGPLTNAEIDGNFRHLDQAIQGILDEPPGANNINSFQVTGTMLFVHMDDGTIFGPYELPVAPYKSAAVLTNSAATLAPILTDANTYTRCTNATGCAVTIPAEATVAYPVGTEISYEQAAAGAITIAGATGVTINKRADREAATDTQGAVVSLKKVAADTWSLFGDLAAV